MFDASKGRMDEVDVATINSFASRPVSAKPVSPLVSLLRKTNANLSQGLCYVCIQVPLQTTLNPRLPDFNVRSIVLKYR